MSKVFRENYFCRFIRALITQTDKVGVNEDRLNDIEFEKRHSFLAVPEGVEDLDWAARIIDEAMQGDYSRGIRVCVNGHGFGT